MRGEPPAGTAGRASGKRKIAILMVDPLPLRRECFARALIIHTKDLDVTAVSDPAKDVAEADAIDVVLLSDQDGAMVDLESDETLQTIQSQLPGVPLVILSAREETEAILAAMQQRSVRGYIPMSLELGLVIEALRFVAAGGTFVPARPLLNSLKQRQSVHERTGRNGGRLEAVVAGFYRIPPRQLQVLDLLRQGKSNKIIAYELHMQESTVKVHVRHIMKKLGATNRTEAAFIAHRLLEEHGHSASAEATARAERGSVTQS